MLKVGFISIYADPEYIKIIRELKAYGLTPSGNKSADKAKLKSKKSELIEKIKHKVEYKAEIKQPVDVTKDTTTNTKNEAAINNLGAMTLASLNRLYHNL